MITRLRMKLRGLFVTVEIIGEEDCIRSTHKTEFQSTVEWRENLQFSGDWTKDEEWQNKKVRLTVQKEGL